MAATFDLYGLRIASEVPLPAPPAGPGGRPPDIRISRGEMRPVPDHPPPGKLMAELSLGGHLGYALAAGDDGLVLRFFSRCDFHISLTLDDVVAHPDPSCDPELVALFIAGTLLACLLMLNGDFALHASAVALDAGVIAFAGGPGIGKSTLAALLCLNGGCLVAEDLLRLDNNGAEPGCYAGVQELRLRGTAASLAAGFEVPIRETADGRIAVSIVCRPTDSRLAAVVLPRPSRDIRSMNLRRLSAKDAAVAAVGASRVAGWIAAQPQRDHLRRSAELARRVPFYAADIPWGPPFRADVAEGLASLGGLPP